jgi:hypothetical protein
MFDPFQQSKLMNGYDKLKTVTMQDLQQSPDEELANMKKLAGIGSVSASTNYHSLHDSPTNQLNQADKARHMRDNNIKPGTDEWFRLWFARPDLTGETPYDK